MSFISDYFISAFCLLMCLSCNKSHRKNPQHAIMGGDSIECSEEKVFSIEETEDSTHTRKYTKETVDSLVALIEKRCSEIEEFKKRYTGYIVIDSPQQIEVFMEHLPRKYYDTFYQKVTNHPLVRVNGGVDYAICETVDMSRWKDVEDMYDNNLSAHEDESLSNVILEEDIPEDSANRRAIKHLEGSCR